MTLKKKREKEREKTNVYSPKTYAMDPCEREVNPMQNLMNKKRP